MHRGCGARMDHAAHDIAMALFRSEIDPRWRAFFAATDVPQIYGLAEPAMGFADQKDRLALGLERKRGRLGEIIEQANAADRGRWQDAAAVGLVVERDIA